MTKEINIIILILSVITGLVNFFFLGLALALTSGNNELTINLFIGYICILTSLVHVLFSSWLFIRFKFFGRVLAILTSIIGMGGSVFIMADGLSLLWLSIFFCFGFTGLFHAINLILKKVN